MVGLDEVGYGPVAGPVVVGAVVLHPDQQFEGATDSKLLAAERREELSGRIRGECLAWCVAAASAREIERLNVRGAAILAMRRALAGLSVTPDLVLVDGKPVRELGRRHRAIVGGDRTSHSIACASILAKVERDEWMTRLDRRYPQYGFAGHKGYGAPEHLEALAVYGPTPEHRLTFRSVLPRREAARG